MQDTKKNPFQDIVTIDWSFLEDGSSRMKCPKCNKSRKYYCYSCCLALPHIQDKLPKVKLPLKVDIIKHPKELDGKSTAPHASILAPDDVTIHTYPCIPDYNQQKVIVVFPGENSVCLDELKVEKTNDDEHQPNCHSKENSNVDVLTEKCVGELDNSCSIRHNRSADSNTNINPNKPNVIHSKCVTVNDTPKSESTAHEFMSNNTQQQSKILDGTVQTSQSESRADLKRKMCNEDGDEGKDNEKIGKKCEDSAAMTKCQKTQMRQCPFDRVVFVDCTWNQTKQIVNDERLKGLQKVELKSQITNFWRSQEGMPKTYLSTIEAIYFFFKDFHTIFVDPVYRHEYDNLLMFFCFMYHKIKQSETVESS